MALVQAPSTRCQLPSIQGKESKSWAPSIEHCVNNKEKGTNLFSRGAAKKGKRGAQHRRLLRDELLFFCLCRCELPDTSVSFSPTKVFVSVHAVSLLPVKT